MKFKDKEYQLKPLFIRDEAALANQFVKLESPDFVTKVDAWVEICHICTGADKGDLNGAQMVEVRDFLNAIMAERARIKAEKEGSGVKLGEETGA